MLHYISNLLREPELSNISSIQYHDNWSIKTLWFLWFVQSHILNFGFPLSTPRNDQLGCFLRTIFAIKLKESNKSKFLNPKVQEVGIKAYSADRSFYFESQVATRSVIVEKRFELHIENNKLENDAPGFTFVFVFRIS